MNRGYLTAAGVCAMALATATANAADLGGNCCADLEERVAELEATVAKKGTRKTSLTVYGWVNKTMLRWDDGVQNNNYMGVDNINSATRFGFRGDAAVNSEWKAGYSILLDINSGASSALVNQRREEAPPGCTVDVNPPVPDTVITCGANAWSNDHSVRMRDANVWLESSRLGRFTLGRLTVPGPQGTIDLGGIANVASASQSLVGGGFIFRRKDTNGFSNATISNATDNLADFSNRVDGIRWDSPTWNGFVFGAAIGEAMHVDRTVAHVAATNGATGNGNLGPLYAVNLRYAGEFNGVRVASAIGYEVSRAEETMGSVNTRPDSENFGLSASFLHTATGLFLQSHWTRFTRGNNDGTSDEAKNWLVQAGLQRNFFGIGNTALYGEISQVKNGYQTFADFAGTNPADNIKYRMWGLGITQNIDAAAMQLYAGYRNHAVSEGTIAAIGGAHDIGIFMAGARINF